jgi:hypothetical protein
MSVLILLRTIIVYSFPVITLIGLITNFISFVIFSRKRFNNTIFSTYFRFSLIFETFNLILPINKMFESNFGMYFSLISNFCCTFRKFYAYSNYSIAAWLLAVISLDRYLSISYPAKFLYRKKFIFQKLTCCFIIGYNYCFYIPYWFFTIKEIKTNRTNQTLITYKCLPPGLWTELLNLVQECLIPFSLMFLFTVLTIRTVFKSRKALSSNNSTSTVKLRDIKFAISSIAISILFLSLSTPYFILLLIGDYSNIFAGQANLFELLYSLSYFLFFLNLSLMFFINYFSNSMFKKEFENLFVCRKNVENFRSK